MVCASQRIVLWYNYASLLALYILENRPVGISSSYVCHLVCWNTFRSDNKLFQRTIKINFSFVVIENYMNRCNNFWFTYTWVQNLSFEIKWCSYISTLLYYYTFSYFVTFYEKWTKVFHRSNEDVLNVLKSTRYSKSTLSVKKSWENDLAAKCDEIKQIKR